MDAHTFDRWTASLVERPTRRTAIRLLVVGLVGGLLAARGVRSTRASQATCVQIGEVCDAAPCCVGECLGPQDAPSTCLCAADGEECIHIGTGACCSGQPCNDAGYCGTCNMPGAPCNSDAECCRGSQFAALCCFDGVSLTTRCTDVSATGLCPGDSPAPTSCPAGQTLCTITTTFCTDLASDPFNCGACGTTCGLGGVCSGGFCNAALAPDSDGDGLTDTDEAAIGTDPLTADTDFDGRSDGQEWLVDNTNPWMPDTPAEVGELEEPEEDPADPPDFEPAPGVLHGDDTGLPADTGGGGGAGGGGEPGMSDPCTIERACGEPERVQEEDRQNNNPQP